MNRLPSLDCLGVSHNIMRKRCGPLLYDGAGISAWMDHDANVTKAAQTVAAALIDSAVHDDVRPVGRKSPLRSRRPADRHAKS
jgi:hypothetical protein